MGRARRARHAHLRAGPRVPRRRPHGPPGPRGAVRQQRGARGRLRPRPRRGARRRERRRASRGGEGSRASQRRRKRAGAGGAAAPAPAPRPGARRSGAQASARGARPQASKPPAKSRATPRPAKRRSGETAAGYGQAEARAQVVRLRRRVVALPHVADDAHARAVGRRRGAAEPGRGALGRDTAAGTGAAAEAGATVAVLYTCRLHATNKRVDHRSNPNSPFTFILGRGAVVEGLDRGLEGMAVGGERELVVPAHLGYGAAGAPPKIPPDAALHFAIKLLRVGDGEDAAKGGKRRRARGARRRPRGEEIGGPRSCAPRREAAAPGSFNKPNQATTTMKTRITRAR